MLALALFFFRDFALILLRLLWEFFTAYPLFATLLLGTCHFAHMPQPFAHIAHQALSQGFTSHARFHMTRQAGTCLCSAFGIEGGVCLLRGSQVQQDLTREHVCDAR